MTRPRGELTTYRARGGHATDLLKILCFIIASPILCWKCCVFNTVYQKATQYRNNWLTDILTFNSYQIAKIHRPRHSLPVYQSESSISHWEWRRLTLSGTSHTSERWTLIQIDNIWKIYQKRKHATYLCGRLQLSVWKTRPGRRYKTVIPPTPFQRNEFSLYDSWIANIAKVGFVSSDSSTICSEHFRRGISIRNDAIECTGA